RARSPGLALVGRSARTTVASTNGVRPERRWSTRVSITLVMATSSGYRQVCPKWTTLDRAPHRGRGEGHVGVLDAEGAQGVHDRVDHRGGRADGGRLAHSLGAQRVVR